MADSAKLIERAEALLARLEKLAAAEQAPTDWKASIAFRWRKRGGRGAIESVRHVHQIGLGDLHGIDRQKKIVEQNTRQFVAGYPANNVLLTGARGTGKSSLIKALLNKYAPRGLRVIEVEKQDLVDLPEIVDHIDSRPERFVLFCDDLSFDADEPGYKALKVVLDGSVAAASENCLIYATSNRRHLMPREMVDNERATAINPGEAVEEKVSLSDRFGLWIGFHNCSQADYLEMVNAYAQHYELKLPAEHLRAEALEWAMTRGSRSGRVAWQYIQDLAGRLGQQLQ
jgi:predicted AAA+ superfamily ATPase